MKACHCVMENFVVFRVLLIFTVISPICKGKWCFSMVYNSYIIILGGSVEISQPSGEVCLGAAVEFNCTVNGTVLGWLYGGVTEFYVFPSGSTSLVSLGSGPFMTRVISVSGGIITSIATASNLTRDANGMTLVCSNGSFVSDTTERASVTLPQGIFKSVFKWGIDLLIYSKWPTTKKNLFLKSKKSGRKIQIRIIVICFHHLACIAGFLLRLYRGSLYIQ